MHSKIQIVALTLGVALMLITGIVQAQGPDGIDTPEDWQVIYPGEDTMCSDGSPYYFLARPGDPDKVWSIFRGAGLAGTASPAAYSNPFLPTLNKAIRHPVRR